jgi:hypothetical protein
MAGEVRLSRKELILFKLETTAGVDAAPTEANSNQAIRVIEPFTTDMGQEFVEVQPGNNTRGFNRPIPTVRPFGVTFKSYLSGIPNSYSAGNKPVLGDAMRACGLFETFTTSNAAGRPQYRYAPAASVGSDLSATIVVHHDGFDQRLVGCRGNVNFIWSAAGPVIAEFTFRGQLTTEAETARGTASFAEVIPPRWIDSGSILVDSFCLDAENLNLNTNNTLYEQRSPCASSGSGILQVIITERNPGGSFDPAATRTNTYDLLKKWRSASESILHLNAGIDQSNQFTINSSMMIHKTVGWGDKSGLSIFNTDFGVYQRNGNDEMEIIAQ